MAAQCILLGAGFCVKILGSALWCHQRSDVVNVSSVLMLGTSFAALWLGFHFGFGLYSMLLSNAAGVLTNALASWLASSWLRLFPARGSWGALSWNVFWEVYDYAKNLFLITIGTQLLMASQVVIVTRVLGLDAAAVWSIATKVFTLAQQIVFRVFDFSVAALVEMFVRGERSLLQKRFRHLVLFTASLSIVVGGAVAVCNSSFLEIWTRGRIAWGSENDMLMAVLLVLYSVVRCYASLMDVTKELRVLKYVSLLEGICFVVLALFLAPKFGFSGVIGAAIVLDIIFMGAYGVWRTAKFFHVSVREILWDWLLPALRMAVIYLPIAGFIWWLTKDLTPLPRLLLCGGVTGGTGVLFLFSVGITRDIRDELFARLRGILPASSKVQ
jgi:O-antigen/teichoic acid export membrane protein